MLRHYCLLTLLTFLYIFHRITILVNRGYVPRKKIKPETRMKGQVTPPPPYSLSNSRLKVVMGDDFVMLLCRWMTRLTW